MEFAVETDDLFVISDTHLGGTEGGQIFDSTEALKWLVGHLVREAKVAKSRQFVLLINGDFVDFLAEPYPVYFDPFGACGRLDRIFKQEPAFRGILGGLRDFVGRPNCRLIVNLGNHDLELALPWVRDHFLDMLSEGNAAARSRVDLLTDGVGCRVTINSYEILCAHGNEVDPWNVTDHERIRRIVRDIYRGRDAETWIPNAGTQMVIDVMNHVKRDYPFVDILKPEKDAVIPILAALKPGLVTKLRDILRTLNRRTLDGGKMWAGFLGDGDEDLRATDTFAYPGIAEAALQERTRAASEQILADANRRYDDKVRPIDLVASDRLSDQLGLWSGIKAWAKGTSLANQLRGELAGLARDRSFDLTAVDETFEEFDELAGKDIDVIVTGHTHLRRALPRKAAKGFYYNTGTWARVAQITDEMLQDEARFDAFFGAVEAGTLAALDNLGGVVSRFNPVFSAQAKGRKVALGLNEVADVGPAMSLNAVAGTTFELG